MKKNYLLVAITLALAWVAPFAGGQDKAKTPRLIEDPLYPLREQQRLVYQVTDNKTKGPTEKKQSVVMTVTKKEVFQIKTKDLGLLDDILVPYVGFNLQVVGGGKVLDEQVLVKEDGVYRVSGAGKTIAPPLCFLKRNAKKGDVWEADSRSENADLKGRFVVDEEDVEVPAGSFKAIVVRCREFQVGAQKMQVDTWYRAGVGMVKQRVQVGNHDVTLELEKVETAK